MSHDGDLGPPGPADDVVVEVAVPPGQLDLVVDLVWSGGAVAVEEVDGSHGAVSVRVGLPTPAAAADLARRLAGRYDARVVAVADRSWRDAWRQFAQARRIGAVTVAPAWRPVPLGPDGPVVEIDPGGCFGSGSHPTTRMLVAALQRYLRPGATVLDVGTGSGILALVAAELGAGPVLAVDIDAEALEVCAANAARNGVGEKITVAAAWEPAPFDLVVANITAGVQAELAGPVQASVGPGGHLLVSGLLPGQWAHVAGGWPELVTVEHLELEGWVGAVLRRPT